MKKYFEVQAMCGHVGRKNYIQISFPVIAENRKEAAEKVRSFARVKHHHKNAILQVWEISLDAYLQLKSENETDPYLHCKNIQEQRQIEDINSRICPIQEFEFWKSRKKKSSSAEYRQKKNRQLIMAHKRSLQEYYAESAIAS